MKILLGKLRTLWAHRLTTREYSYSIHSQVRVNETCDLCFATTSIRNVFRSDTHLLHFAGAALKMCAGTHVGLRVKCPKLSSNFN
jgi:hypothetical protein